MSTFKYKAFISYSHSDDKRLGRHDRVFPIIVDGEPHARYHPQRGLEECFPEALRRGRCKLASYRLRRFEALVNNVSFDASIPFNHEGNLISRSSNLKFTLDVKVIPFAY